MNEIDKFITNSMGDIENVAKESEVDVVKAVNIFTEVVGNVIEDLDVAGEIISIINPTLAAEVVAIAQFAGAIDTIFEVLENAKDIINANNPEVKTISDYQIVRNSIEKALKIWHAQKKLIIHSAKEIEKKAVAFQNPIINIEKNITGGEGI